MKIRWFVLALLALLVVACGAQATPIVIVVTAQPQALVPTPRSLPPVVEDFCTCATSPATMTWLDGSMALADEITAVFDEYGQDVAYWPSAQEVDSRIRAAVSALPPSTPCVQDMDDAQVTAAAATIAFAEAADQGDLTKAERAQAVFLDSQATIWRLIEALMSRCDMDDDDTSY